MNNPQIRGAQRHVSDTDERRRLLREMLQERQQPQTADEYEDEYEDEDEELEPEPERPSRRSPRRSPRQRSRPATRSGGYSTAVIDGAAVDRAFARTVQGAAWAMLGVSIFGSIIAFNGGWEPKLAFWQGISLNALIAGLALQGVITLIEWRYRNHKLSLIYLFTLAVDAGMTFIGYNPVIGPRIGQALSKALADSQIVGVSSGLAVVLVAVGAILLAILPEKWLIRR